MRMVDTKCPRCGTVRVDVLLREKDAGGEYVLPRCTDDCGATTERVHIGQSGYVHGDDIPGGMLIHNGICNADGTPRRYYSRSEMAREAKARGLVNMVRHQGRSGGDKNRHTQRFI